MRRLRLLLRLASIQWTLLRHGLDELVFAIPLFRPLAWLQRWLPRHGARRGPLGERIRLALEELGPLFVKFGQALSVRRDLLPPEIADELVKLQDQVPPFPSDLAIETLERAFDAPIDKCFASFDEKPLAAASIAQVHAATLPGGEEAIVKILRPNVKTMVRRDLEVLFAFAELAERYWPPSKRLHPVAVVAEFEKSLSGELDLMREAASASQLRRNFADSSKLYVPDVYWDYCRSNVLTMERIHGIPISDTARLKALGTNIRRLAENGVDIFFTQVFRHNFFHADMHPGNIFVDVTDPEQPRYVAVDFGIMGTLSPEDQRYLAANFLAFFQRDYHRVAALHVDSGWVPRDTRVDELEAAVRAVCEPIFNRPLREISFGLVLMRLFETARRFDMEVQPQLVLLQKTLLAIEGLGRELYPQLDLWATAKPILEDWMRERSSPLTHLQELGRQWPQLSDDLLALPDLLHAFVRDLRRRPFVRERAEPTPTGARGVASKLVAGTVLSLAGLGWSATGGSPVWLAHVGLTLGALLLLIAVLTRRAP